VTAQYNFTVRAGNSGSVENEVGLEVILTAGNPPAPVDMSGDAIVFRVLSGTVQALRKETPAILVNLTTGRITVPLTVADSRTLQAAGGVLTYDLERRPAAGGQRTIVAGRVFVEEAANDD
jgi:hypothetical protein